MLSSFSIPLSFSIPCIMFPFLGIWKLGKRIKVIIRKHSKANINRTQLLQAFPTLNLDKDIRRFNGWRIELYLFRSSVYC